MDWLNLWYVQNHSPILFNASRSYVKNQLLNWKKTKSNDKKIRIRNSLLPESKKTKMKESNKLSKLFWDREVRNANNSPTNLIKKPKKDKRHSNWKDNRLYKISKNIKKKLIMRRLNELSMRSSIRPNGKMLKECTLNSPQIFLTNLQNNIGESWLNK